MTNTIIKLSLAFLALTSIACQKTPVVEDGTFTEEQTGTTIVNNLCDDGSLDCVIADNPFTDTSSILTQLYQQCVIGCVQQSAACSITATDQAGAFAQAQSCATYSACNTQCDDILETEAEDPWASDELKIPDNAKAIEVEIKVCVDTQVHNVITMQGTTVSIPHYRTTTSQMMGSPGIGALGNPIGQNLKCKVEGLYNRAKVTYKPVTSTSVTIKDVPHTVVPFTISEEIEKKYKSPQVASFGIPKTYLDEMNVNQVAWVASKATTILNAPVPVKFQYLNNDLGPGISLLHIIPPFHWAPMTFKFVFFAESK